jgi:rhodanese-related sulfurtransferase
MFLEQMGFSSIINLQGGVAAWARDVDPAMPTY